MNKIVLDARIDQSAIPVISVALPVYNGEGYLTEALDSILSQTYTNFELIIIDDGSTDNSLEVLQNYQKRDARIRLITRENRNLATTLNNIICVARGKWIARMDQDDIALPQRFERQLQWLEQTGADVCGSWVNLFGTSDKRILQHPQTDEAIKMELLFGSPFAHPTVMMKADLVKKLRYDKTWEKVEDYDLWERAARAGWKMTNVPEVLLLYRQHGTQISTASSSRQQALSQKIRRRYWEFVFDSMNLKKEWIDEVLKLREPLPMVPNMNDVDSAFMQLLKRTQGEERATVFDHATRLYFRAAATCPDIVLRWRRLNKIYGSGFAYATRMKLWFLSVFRIRSNSKLFSFLKKIYFYFIRST